MGGEKIYRGVFFRGGQKRRGQILQKTHRGFDVTRASQKAGGVLLAHGSGLKRCYYGIY